MKTNDIKKGDRIRLRNGWYGTMMDNARTNTRVVDVEGLCRETGSVYAHDIVSVQIANEYGDTVWVTVEHTPSQLKVQERDYQLFGEAL